MLVWTPCSSYRLRTSSLTASRSVKTPCHVSVFKTRPVRSAHIIPSSNFGKLSNGRLMAVSIITFLIAIVIFFFSSLFCVCLGLLKRIALFGNRTIVWRQNTEWHHTWGYARDSSWVRKWFNENIGTIDEKQSSRLDPFCIISSPGSEFAIASIPWRGYEVWPISTYLL